GIREREGGGGLQEGATSMVDGPVSAHDAPLYHGLLIFSRDSICTKPQISKADACRAGAPRLLWSFTFVISFLVQGFTMKRLIRIPGIVLVLAASAIVYAGQATEAPISAVVESSLESAPGQIRQFAFDGNPGTYFASARNPTADDH